MNTSGFPFATLSPSTATDEVLASALRGCASGSMQDFTRLYELTAARLLAQLVLMLGDRAAAEQSLQECFVRIWQRARTFNPERARPYAWLLSIVRHHAIDHLRAHRSTDFIEEVDVALLLADAAERRMEPDATGQALQRCMLALSVEQQHCLRLAYATGRSQEEVAGALQLPLAAVKSGIRRALWTLRECIDP